MKRRESKGEVNHYAGMQFSWFKTKAKNKRVYLDYAAATPLSLEVLKAMRAVEAVYANPSAIHQEGVAARKLIESARVTVAKILKIRSDGVVFTGSGTESNNLAIYGSVRAKEAAGVPFTDMEVISTKLEHPSVSEVLKHLAEIGVTIKYVDVDEKGLIDCNHFESLLSPKVVLVTFAYVNSEIGVIEPVGRLARLVKKFNQTHQTDIKVHIDAAQAPLWLPCQLDHLGVDLLSLDAGKCYGPKGVGILAFRHGVSLLPVTLGGGQESGLRAATENTVSIVGAAKALEIAQTDYKTRAEKVQLLRDSLIKKLTAIPGVVLNGSNEDGVANNVNVSIDGVDGEFAVVCLDEAGFAVSTKSACSGADGGGSQVVREINGDAARAASTLRITLGEQTTAKEIDGFVKALENHIEKTRTALKTLTLK